MAVELVPQGTSSNVSVRRRLWTWRVLTPTGIGTLVEEGNSGSMNGKSYLLETALYADFALSMPSRRPFRQPVLCAHGVRNFNPVMAMAASTTIVTVDHIVPVGVIDLIMSSRLAPLVDFLVTNANMLGRQCRIHKRSSPSG